MVPTRLEVLKLYKELLRYGEMLVFTDKNYYKNRIRKEFLENKDAAEEHLEYLYKSYGIKTTYKFLFSERESSSGEKENSLMQKCAVEMKRGKSIDKSLMPQLNESDLEEKFIKGEGPGGQFVNKRNTCVCLVHKPTGLSVKIGESREQHMNRKLAREKMRNLLDSYLNKENSVESQKARIMEEKLKKKIQKQKKLHEKKKAWKEIMAGYSDSDQ